MAGSSHLIALFVKLAAASVTGAVALLAFRRHLRDEALSALRRDIRISLLRMRADVLPLPRQELLREHRLAGPRRRRRALPGPRRDGAVVPCNLCPARLPRGGGGPRRRVAQYSQGREREADDNGAAALDLVDSPGLPEAEKLTRADVEATLSLASPSPECILLVLRCSGPQRTNLRRLQDIAAVVRERGLHLVVVLTHRNSLRSAKQSEELRREVALRAKTDSVYLIENYTATAFKNSFSTHCNALAVIRQCVEFAAMHRRHRASAAQKSSPPSTLGAQKSVFE
ncbi:unnamed protein product [Spirodela intermedia]|uniref:Uncharacterized protein n=1 Tax=Spirodela intermedia TaxID=51605 RepID=A0A7I8JMV3_SPIIN|nr:unnamed protein product [Spirodela intermedia]CAA6671459.1 unnamed protein product [Spirodela intermedia]